MPFPVVRSGSIRNGSASTLDLALESAGVTEETTLEPGLLKELLLLVDWKRPLHVVVVVDHQSRKERIVTVYDPHRDRWSSES